MRTFIAMKHDATDALNIVADGCVTVFDTACDGVVNAYRIARQLAHEKRVARRARKILREAQLNNEALCALIRGDVR